LISAIVRTAITGLRRDRASLALSFVLPIAFFTIFAMVFSGQHDTIPQVKLIVVDQDHSSASRNLVRALQQEGSLLVTTHPDAKGQNAPTPPDYTADTAEAQVKAGNVPVALIIPAGWGQHPLAFNDSEGKAPEIQLLNDQSDTIAPQIVAGLLQKAAMTSMPASMAGEGEKYMKQYIGGLTPEQQKRWDANMTQLNALEKRRDDAQAAPTATATDSGSGFSSGMIKVETRGVVGEHKNKNMISFYAAAIGVMFLLFTASGSAGSLLEEQESGTLDRVLSSRVTMTTLLAGKLTFNTLLAFTQLTVMFLWGWAVFHLEIRGHVSGFVVMGLCTAFAVAAFGIFLASMCHTRGQLGAVSTLLILVMSAVGGSMFPRYMMPQAMQKAGLFTINGWAIDGFQKVFWRDLPIPALWPQVGVLLGIGIVLFVLSRRIARRWEFA
jgi:ABC-2 type transport system permease protein